MSTFCKNPHRYWSILNNLPDSQAGNARHKDVQAAYELGYRRAQLGLPKE